MCEASHSDRAKAAISGFLVVFLALVVSANVPLPGFRKAVGKVDDPVLAAVGPRQVWNVFAPDPPRSVASVLVRFTYRDGTRSAWRVPSSDYRWLKLAENTAPFDQAGAGLLAWAARTQAGPKPLARADLIRTVYDVAPIGRPQRSHPPARSGVLFSLRGQP